MKLSRGRANVRVRLADLRQKLAELAQKENINVFFPRPEFCTDNGAMIAYAGCLRLMAGQTEPLEIIARARWPMEELASLED